MGYCAAGVGVSFEVGNYSGLTVNLVAKGLGQPTFSEEAKEGHKVPSQLGISRVDKLPHSKKETAERVSTLPSF